MPDLTPSHKSADWLRDRYEKDEMTTVQIAALCGVSHKTISRYLQKAGIPTRDPQSAQLVSGAASKRRMMLSDIRDYTMAGDK